MARKAFYSFHYVPDNWRASQVRNMWVIEGNQPATDNDWETVKSRGDSAIQRWIDEQMSGKSVVIVLIGAETAGRKWINYEIKKGWNDRKGVVGIYIHNLKNRDEFQSRKGNNPFLSVGNSTIATAVKTYDPPYTNSQYVHDHIKNNLSTWIEEAIQLRGCYA